MQKIERSRKVRNDKKRDVKPTVPTSLKLTVARLSFITSTPIKDICEYLCMEGFSKRSVIECIAKEFRRDVRIHNTLYLGNAETKRSPKSSEEKDRIAIRFHSDMHDKLSVLAYALASTVSYACAVLLEAALNDADLINDFAEEYMNENLDEERMEELRRILQHIQTDSPNKSVEFSWAALLSYMVDEVKETTTKVQNTVSEFVIHHWKK